MSYSVEDRRFLHEFLQGSYNLDELFTLVSGKLGADYEDVRRETKERTCLEVILYMERRGRLRALVDAVRAERPSLTLDAMVARIPEGPLRLDAGEVALQGALAHLATMPEEPPDPAPLPPGSRVGMGRNPHFTGRAEDLRQLARALKGGETVAIGQVAGVTGLGGIGKTQLANEFAHRYGQFFAGGVFWLSFAAGVNVPSEVATCGFAMKLWPDGGEMKLEEQVARVQRAWQEETPRLLVFDNCEEEALLAAWRPTTGGCRVLLTSRRATWAGTLGVQTLPLGVLKREESHAMLAKYRPDLAGNTLLDDIAKELGDLPLALHLAGSYLKCYQHHERLGDPAHYLEQLARPDLLNHPSMQGKGAERNPTGHEQHVARTFALSYERLDKRAPVDALALALLARAACLAPGEAIPRALLIATLELPAEDDAAAMQAEDALARLLALGLMEENEEKDPLLHRLMVLFVRQCPSPPAATRQGCLTVLLSRFLPSLMLQLLVERVVQEEASRLNEVGYPAALLPILPHLHHLTDLALPRGDKQAASLANSLAYILEDQGAYAAARPYYEHALAIHDQVLGPNHLDTAGSLNNLGHLLARQGEYEAARPCLERALRIVEKELGPQGPVTATCLDNLGGLLSNQGDYAAARPYHERALAIREQALGPTHRDTAHSLNNLGRLLSSQGDYAAAHVYLDRALAIREVVLGLTHPDTAHSSNNLGMLLSSQGDHAAARPYLERALAIREEVLGPSHPDTARSLNNLGGLLHRQGDYAAARPYVERALTIYEEVLGPRHPDTATSLNNLGALLNSQGDYAAARPYYERALAIYEEVLGPTHPNTANSLYNLGTLLSDQGDYAAARPYYERALAIREQVLGPNHPDTQTVRDNLAALDAKLSDKSL